ncbi:phosphoesterase RecJ-like protein [Motilibacter rhizosphaerae]|uniref:Phosphoesterase RecJ-like protein n=1 Tax=Motilibacter rhizosphaerae TaxID=598652 RepID=A0A4Q7NNX9_9ACTN|nr:DHHA1 domain-containing protein [Motilibacter rhizosphaerae]RZS86951.1 phosphoesterase RecJ-like protein [Motilibacter rhizosphaerae]
MSAPTGAHPVAAVQADWRAALDDVAALLERPAGPVVLAAHVAPDGDALGSVLAVARALRQVGVEALVSWGEEPLEVPRSLGALLALDPALAAALTPPSRLPEHVGVLACFDLASRGRLGLLSPLVDTAEAVVAVDHHTSHVPFAHVTALDPAAPATAVLAAELVERLSVPLDAVLAGCLWVGLVTDTGSFRHPSTTPAALRLAARLLDAGAEGARLSRAVLEEVPGALLPVLGEAVAGARLEPGALGGAGLVLATVPRERRAAAGLAVEELVPVLDVVRRAAEADVAACLLQQDDGAWRVSLRSRGPLDVSVAAVALGGGGHRMAAGTTLTGSEDEAVAAVRAALEALA